MKNRKKKESGNLGKMSPFVAPSPWRSSKGHPRRGEVLRRSEGLPRCDEAKEPEKAPSGSPRRSPATPSEALHLDEALLRCGEVTVHIGKFSDFCFRTLGIHIPIV